MPESKTTNTASGLRNAGNGIIHSLAILGVLFGTRWVFQRHRERDAARQREISRSVDWDVSPDGVRRLYRPNPKPMIGPQMREIEKSFHRSLLHDVPEDDKRKVK